MVMLSHKLQTLNPADSLPKSKEYIDLIIAGIGKGHPDIEVSLVGYMTNDHSWSEFESYARHLCSRREEQLNRNAETINKTSSSSKDTLEPSKDVKQMSLFNSDQRSRHKSYEKPKVNQKHSGDKKCLLYPQ